MFTGIIQEVGRVAAREGGRLEVRCSLRSRRPGESVAVNGACLTVLPGGPRGRLRFDLSGETLDRTNLGALAAGSRVNLERALRAGDGLGGHLVSGHVDARGRVLSCRRLPGGFVRLRVSLPPALEGLVAVKGSVAVDGVSLTVTAVSRGRFETVLVPHTLRETTLAALRPGDPVNLEADLVARYLLSLLEAGRGARRGRPR